MPVCAITQAAPIRVEQSQQDLRVGRQRVGDARVVQRPVGSFCPSAVASARVRA